MGFIISFAFLAMAFGAYKNNNAWYNPATIVAGMFSVISFCAQLQLFDLINTSITTWILIFIAILSFYLGTYIISTVDKSKDLLFLAQNDNIRLSPENEDTPIKDGLLILVVILCYVVAFLYLRDVWGYFVEYGLAMTRMIYFDVDGYLSSAMSGAVKYILLNYFYVPVMWAFRPIWVYLLFFGQKICNRWKLFFAITILFFFEVVITGGRIQLLILIIMLLVGASTSNRIILNKIMKQRIKVVCLIFIFVLVVGIVYASISRLSHGVFYTIYKYLCMCIPHLSYRLDCLGKKYTFGYGLAGFYGILGPILNFGSFLGLPYSEHTTEILSEIDKLQSSVNLGGNNTFNAFVTPVFRLYLDSGVFGVVMGMLLFGIISTYYYQRIHLSRRYLIIYFYIISGLVRMYTTYPFSDVNFVLGLFYTYLLTRKTTVLEFDKSVTEIFSRYTSYH